MYTSMIKQNIIKGKAFIFLCIYVVQLFCYQALIVATSDTNTSIRKCFSPSQQDTNSAISVFRTLEKHCEYGKDVSIKKNANAPVSNYTASAPLEAAIPAISHNRTIPLRLSDVSYKRYLSVKVFRI